VLHLVHKLQVGRHARGRIQPELDRRRGRGPPGLGRAPIPAASARRGDTAGPARPGADVFIYIHKTKIQRWTPLSSMACRTQWASRARQACDSHVPAAPWPGWRGERRVRRRVLQAGAAGQLPAVTPAGGHRKPAPACRRAPRARAPARSGMRGGLVATDGSGREDRRGSLSRWCRCGSLTAARCTSRSGPAGSGTRKPAACHRGGNLPAPPGHARPYRPGHRR
jgi:hypothetical protein